MRRVAIKQGHRLFRVTLTGPECTGKSTLSRELGRRLKAPVSQEAARTYVNRHQGALSLEDVAPIARAQILAEERAIEIAESLVIHDTDLLSTCAYSNLYFQSIPNWLEGVAHSRRADHYLLCDIDIPWVPDGPQRTAVTEEERRHHFDHFTALLDRHCCSVDTLSGQWEKRLDAAIAHIRCAEEAFLKKYA